MCTNIDGENIVFSAINRLIVYEDELVKLIRDVPTNILLLLFQFESFIIDARYPLNCFAYRRKKKCRFIFENEKIYNKFNLYI